jgi:hypothetical protein
MVVSGVTREYDARYRGQGIIAAARGRKVRTPQDIVAGNARPP